MANTIQLIYMSDDPETQDPYYQGVFLKMGEEGLPDYFRSDDPFVDVLTAMLVGTFRTKKGSFKPDIKGVGRYEEVIGKSLPEDATPRQRDKAFMQACIWMDNRGEENSLNGIALPDKMEMLAILKLRKLLGTQVEDWYREVDHEPDEHAMGPMDAFGTCTVMFQPPDGNGTILVTFQGWNTERGDVGSHTISMVENQLIKKESGRTA